MTLQIQSRFDAQRSCWDIELEGEVDISNAAQLRIVLNDVFQQKKSDIILHLDRLLFLDSTGLGVIIGAYGRMKDQGFDLLLKNPRENIEKLLRITSLDKLLCPELCQS